MNSQATATATRFGCFVELAIDVLFFFFCEISPLYFRILFEGADVAEEHVPVPLFELEPRM
jgi:hypothetical protein